MNATEPKVRTIIAMLEQRGYGIQYVGPEHRRVLRANVYGESVERYLHRRTVDEASEIISLLKEE